MKKLTGKRVVTPGNRCSCQELVETDTAEDRCRLFFSASFNRACTLGRFHGHLYHPRRFFCVKVYKGKELRWTEMIRIYIFFPSPFRLSPSLSIFFLLYALFFFSRASPLRFAHPVACCCELLRVVAQNLKPVKLLATCKRTQQLPAMLRPGTRSTSATEVKPTGHTGYNYRNVRITFECRGTLNA